MSNDISQLERRVEREMAALRALPDIQPGRACIERVQAAVIAAGARNSGWGPWPWQARPWIGAAAALVLAIGWVTQTPPATPVDPETLLADWASAWEESSERLVVVLDEGWLFGAGDDGVDEDAELDDLFQGLDQSFDRFEAL